MSINPDPADHFSSGAISATASAKINLALHVTGLRPDGYHLIETLCVFTAFGDQLTVAPAEQDIFEITGSHAGGLSVDRPNLVIRVRETLRKSFPATAVLPVAIRLKKNLPVASGIGGGSSDAACVLKLLSAHWQLDASDSKLREIGITLGADIPMCLAGKPLIARGIGDELEMVWGVPQLHLVLVNSGITVPTGEVFGSLARKQNSALAQLPDARSLPGLINWLGATRNDLEEPAIGFAPSIDEAAGLLRECGAAFTRMSGSGATVFGIFESENASLSAESAIAKQRPQWFVKATRAGGSVSG